MFLNTKPLNYEFNTAAISPMLIIELSFLIFTSLTILENKKSCLVWEILAKYIAEYSFFGFGQTKGK